MAVINNQFVMESYQSKKPFSSFLSGVAGKKGIPIWSFYVNRGQAISSFGVRDKNGQILEFYPANKAYLNTSRIGFRTFIRLNNETYEFFKHQTFKEKMSISPDKLVIEDTIDEIKIMVRVTYLTLPNEPIGALMRKVEVINLSDQPLEIEVLDGLTQILPSGIDYGGYKAVSNLLQSWMDVDLKDNHAFYKLRASTADSAVINDVTDGHFMISSVSNTDFKLYADTKLIFGYDTGFDSPVNFTNGGIDRLEEQKQVFVNQVACGFVGFKKHLKDQVTICSLYGYTHDSNHLTTFSSKVNLSYFNQKEIENEQIITELTNPIDVTTSSQAFDQYMKQNFLDNLLRGGVPFVFETKDGPVAYHLFSRKHGDLERDYNFYVIEPEFYSQGNGNFRDVLQNRRNDVLFYPEVKDHNIRHFYSLIQADGYNPLSIEGLKFIYTKTPPKELASIIEKPFTPGQVINSLVKGLHTFDEAEKILRDILKDSSVQIEANFGEGYWQDHFTYLQDLIEAYLAIYPETKKDLLFSDRFYRFFNSNIYVKPRNEKYIKRSDGNIRQYHGIKHLSDQGKWLKVANEEIKVELYSKMITLVLTKYGLLDPYGIGISYEADKPGWNDAMNGLPALFSSGVSEMIELRRIVKFLKSVQIDYRGQSVHVLSELMDLSKAYVCISDKSLHKQWELRQEAVELYRLNVLTPKGLKRVEIDQFDEVLNRIDHDLDQALMKAKSISPMLPTYLTYEAVESTIIKEVDGQTFVKVEAFELHPITEFLEAPARYLKQSKDVKTSKGIYEMVKHSELYDKKMKFYQTSRPLDNYSNEIGRIRAFTKGWLERESNFLHMTYKYLLGLIKSGLYEEFYQEIKTNFVCFMDENVYGRSILENSSFIVTGTNPDEQRHGQGFVSRLSGSTAEMLSIYQQMFYGNELFKFENGELVLYLKPNLNHSFFKDKQVKTTFMDSKITYINPDLVDTYDKEAVIEKIEVIDQGQTFVFKDSIRGQQALNVRNKNGLVIKVFIKREEKK